MDSQRFAPTQFSTLFEDDNRFYKGYPECFESKWLDTGNAGMITQDDYVHFMSTSDDIINVAAYRFSTGECFQLRSKIQYANMFGWGIRIGNPLASRCCRSLRCGQSRRYERPSAIHFHLTQWRHKRQVAREPRPELYKKINHIVGSESVQLRLMEV